MGRISSEMIVTSPSEVDKYFFKLCETNSPTYLCDVGTRDCSDAIRIKTTSPSSLVYAFEANPENFFEFCCTDKVIKHGVLPQLCAISNLVGEATVNVPHYASSINGGTIQQRGTSSLLEKNNTSQFIKYKVPQTTLDTFFSFELSSNRDLCFGFWIDVEGLAKQVLEGMSNVLTKTRFVKIELEDVPYYKDQSLGAEIRRFMQERGFYESFRTDTKDQQDSIFERMT